MFLLFLFSTIVFVFTAFLSTPPTEDIVNPFSAFIQTEMTFMVHHLLIFIIGFLLAIILFITSQKFDRGYSLVKNYLFSILQVFIVVLVGFFTSFAVLLIIAVFELNISALLLNTNPNWLGIDSHTQSIVAAIQSRDTPPEIVASDKEQRKELFAVVTATTGNTNFYGKYALPAIPNFLIIPVRKSDASLLLIDNTLIITSLSQDDLQRISPDLGYLFLKNYFWRRPIKSSPKLTIMNRKEYAQYRRNDSQEKILKIDLDITKLRGYSSSLSAAIQQDQKLLAAPNLRQGSAEENNVQQKLQQDQDELVLYNYYDSFFKTQRDAVQHQENNLPNELGVFEPKNAIKIALDTTSSHAIADYLETETHEYLHYASYVSKTQKFSSTFFEEGLTEYFARNIIEKELKTSTNLGYPVQVKIITEMTKTIPESEFADIYFTKDEGALIDILDRSYGDGFYENNQILFESLQYTSNPQQALKLANTIMKKIGGNKLTQKDLYSNYSKL